jgi:putative FmdB family regulatory protein
MPFYEYECDSCKYYVEVMQKISDAPLKKCPSCGKSALKKLISAPVFRLKGGGWYETDFKSDKENKRNLAGADKEESKESKPAEAATESKPAESKPVEAKASAPKAEAPERRSRKSVAISRKPAAKPAPKAKAKAKSKTARKARR